MAKEVEILKRKKMLNIALFITRLLYQIKNMIDEIFK